MTDLNQLLNEARKAKPMTEVQASQYTEIVKTLRDKKYTWPQIYKWFEEKGNKVPMGTLKRSLKQG